MWSRGGQEGEGDERREKGGGAHKGKTVFSRAFNGSWKENLTNVI